MAFRHKSGLNVLSIIDPIYLCMAIVAMVNRFYLRYTGNWFIDFYLNDLLSVPVTLYLSSIIMGFIYGCLPYPIDLKKIVFTTVIFSAVFEWLMPELSIRYTRDLYDVLVYFSGGAFYFLREKLIA